MTNLVTQIIGKFKLFFAWLAGYFIGKKVGKLEQEAKAKNETIKKIISKVNAKQKVRNKWDAIRKKNPSSDPSGVSNPVRKKNVKSSEN